MFNLILDILLENKIDFEMLHYNNKYCISVIIGVVHYISDIANDESLETIRQAILKFI